ncbi:MAG TPA: hypothetical protein VE710_23845 [Candidatus Bathyarchaeia archaeon]|nr:hypothetical protein [Candidatus Bathyarchaeia archaeon]
MKAFDYYGRYHTLPQTIERLLEFEKELSERGYSLDLDLGLIMEEEDIRYMATPPDVIPFARPGADGIHYGFLTDFGSVKDLEEAYIVCVSPMDFGEEVWVVAKNIRDFLRIVYTENSILYNHFPDVDSYVRYMEKREEEESDEQTIEAREMFKERFSINPIEDMVQYIIDLHDQRKRAIAVPTINSLGVTQMSSEKEHERFLLHSEQLDEEDFDQVRSFFKRASVESKLAFIRDVQTKNVLEDRELRELVKNELRSFGMEDEANRLELSYT